MERILNRSAIQNPPVRRSAIKIKITMSKPDVSQIYGKIQYVSAFPDYTVEVVSAFEDLSVQEVGAFPDKPGKWQVVNAFPDYKIQIVKAFGDFKIRYVNAFPGPRK